MALRRFCDICDSAFKPEDEQPLVRTFKYGAVNDNKTVMHTAKASVMITNEHGHVVADICIPCRIKIINEGESIATLQPMTASPQLYAAAPLPPPTPAAPVEMIFESSIKPPPQAPQLSDED